jgi:hypothetical protein
MGAWAHDFAFMTLPIFGLLLAAIFMFRPGFVLFDHMIFAMHSLSFAGLLLLTVLLADHFFGDAALLLLLLLPVHQYVHMRGVYGTGAAGTALRLGVLALTSATAFGIVLVGLVLLGLAALKA